jgi:hypothetical protein
MTDNNAIASNPALKDDHNDGYLVSGNMDDIVTRLEEAGRVGSLCWEAASEIERLRECLQHAIDHVGKWQLFTAEEKQRILAEYEQAVRGE